MSLTIDHNGMDGKIVLDTESREYPTLKAYPRGSGYAYGDYAYLGYNAQDDLRALAKAILNAVEPEALAVDQRTDLPAERTPLDPGPEPYKPQVGDVVRVSTPQYARNWGRGEHRIVTVYGALATIEHPMEGRGAFPFNQLELVTPASAPTPEQPYDIPGIIAALAHLQDRVADLEDTAKDDEIKVGDLVRYTANGALPGEIREVTDIYDTGVCIRYRLVHTTGYLKGEQAHSGASRGQIEKVN